MDHFLSDEFFHLVGRAAPDDDERNYRTLKAILTTGGVLYKDAVPGKSPTSVSVDLTKNLAAGELVVPSITCYCDIPFSSIGFHARKYGRFGLSFHRDLLIQRGARPVMYVPMRSDNHHGIHGRTLLREMQEVYRGFDRHFLEPRSERSSTTRYFGREPADTDGVVDALDSLLTLHFLSFVKPYDSQLGEDHIDYYYSEREWRMTNYLLFIAADVARVVVADGFSDRLAAELPQYRDKLSIVTAPKCRA